jgi:putative oxidoreductase
MKMVQRILGLGFIPASTDLALLVLRVWFGGAMLVLHGWGKLSKFQELSGKFADPLGIGSKASLSLAVFGEVVAPVLLIFGLLTRFSALSAAITMAVAFFLAHKGVLKGPGNGEMAFIYLAGFVAIFLAGPGRFSIDGGGTGNSRGESKGKRDSRR